MSMMNKEDCFAFRGGICRALTVKRCDNCRFYKTQAQHAKDVKEAKRIYLNNVRGAGLR